MSLILFREQALKIKKTFKREKNELSKEISRKQKEISRKKKEISSEFTIQVKYIKKLKAISTWQTKSDMVNVKLITEDNDHYCRLLDRELQHYNGKIQELQENIM